MKEDEKWKLLQEEAKRMAERELLEALLAKTGLDKYIADAIESHEKTYHDEMCV